MSELQRVIKDLLDEGYTLDQIKSVIESLTEDAEEEGES